VIPGFGELGRRARSFETLDVRERLPEAVRAGRGCGVRRVDRAGCCGEHGWRRDDHGRPPDAADIAAAHAQEMTTNDDI
jgi:hypothetical protein